MYTVGGLGINKDLEPIARAWRRAGGEVAVTGSNHVRWTRPDGTWLQTGLTMNARSSANAKRQLEHELAVLAGTATAAPRPRVRWKPVTVSGGKWNLIDDDGQPLLNAGGYPRTFGSRRAAQAAAACL
jgi:hypothetical protein